jgi:hypothetical protein
MANVKIVMEDYTKIEPNVMIERGMTGNCPVCERVGVIAPRKAQIRYIHGSTWEVGDGPPIITNDICLVP